MCALHIGTSSGTVSKTWIVNAIVFQMNVRHLLSEGVVQANLWQGSSPFAVRALSSGGWRFSGACTESASPSSCPRLVKRSRAVPSLPPCLLAASLACPPWLLYLRLTLSTVQAYFCPLAWLSDLSPNTFPEPFTLSTNSDLYAHWDGQPWGSMTKMPCLLGDLRSKWGMTNPARSFLLSTSTLGKDDTAQLQSWAGPLHRQNLFSILRGFCY